MKINVRKTGRVNVLDCSGKMTMGMGDVALRDKIKELLDAGERSFLFNMMEVPYMDSSALGELVASYKRISEKQGSVKLVLNPKGREIITLPKLHLVFEIFSDVESGIGSFAR